MLGDASEAISDLAVLFATAYERGRYGRSIDYAAPPRVALAAEDLAWSGEQAKAPRG